MTENSLFLDLHHFCCFLVKWQVAENFLPVSQISFYKTAIIFKYDKKFITFLCLSFLLTSYKVASHRRFSAILFLKISFCFLKYFCVLASNTPINIVSIWSLKCSMWALWLCFWKQTYCKLLHNTLGWG